jgi:hypothetical protein
MNKEIGELGDYLAVYHENNLETHNTPATMTTAGNA